MCPKASMALISLDVWCISIIVTIVTLFLILRLRKTKSISDGAPIRTPPGPLVLPIIGHLHLLTSWFLPGSLHKLSLRYGPLMNIRIGGTSFMIVSDSNVGTEIFKNHDVAFSSRFGGSSSSSENLDKEKRWSFFAAEYGIYWKFAKKLCMSEVLSAARIAELSDIRRHEIFHLLNTLLEHSHEGRACNLTVPFMAMTNNIISQMVMGKRMSGDMSGAARVRKIVDEFSRFSSKMHLGGMFNPLQNLDYFRYKKRFGEAYMQYVVMLDNVITEHERDVDGIRRKDLIDAMLKINNEKSAPVDISRTNITAITLDIFMGGTGSMASELQWILAELINHPVMFKKVRDEIESVVGSDRLIEEKDVQQLPYFQAVIKEGMRLHPITAIILRSCREYCKINGYDILPDTRVMINVYAIMRDPKLWHDPDKFIPERFLVDSTGSGIMSIVGDWGNRVNENYEYVPFGGGRRRCPGAGLSTSVIHVAIASLVQCFDWKPKGGEQVDMKEAPGLAIEMAHPMECYPIARANIPKFKIDSNHAIND